VIARDFRVVVTVELHPPDETCMSHVQDEPLDLRWFRHSKHEKDSPLRRHRLVRTDEKGLGAPVGRTSETIPAARLAGIGPEDALALLR
jgi:hypothetical protein